MFDYGLCEAVAGWGGRVQAGAKAGFCPKLLL